MSNFFTSDTHFYHENIIKFCNRPFGSAEHMNHELVKNWNTVVQPSDHVWFVGDFSFGNDEQTEEIVAQLRGHKHLIVGNHDRKGRCEKFFRDKWDKYFEDRHDYYRLKVDGHKIILCHFPFSSWERGYYNFHGHLHTLPHEYQGKLRQHDVGVDNNKYAPIKLEDAIRRSITGKEDNAINH